MKNWRYDDVAKWVTSIEGIPDDINTTLLENNINGTALLVMGWEELKEIGMDQVGSLALLLEEIKNLCRENKSEAVLIDHNVYQFKKIL